MVVIERELSLTAVQHAHVESVLRDREQEIQACHQEIRASGVLNVREYEWQVMRMKDSWFQRIDQILDSDQHEKFRALVARGFFNEGLSFTVEPEMTVLD